MAIAATSGVVHLPFGERPQYGQPYPEGIAVAHIDQTGDASGGAFSMTILADAGFLYRFEGMQMARGVSTVIIVDYITSHRWASDKSGRGNSAFDLNWICAVDNATGFAVYKPGGARGTAVSTGGNNDLAMIRRLPMGRLDNVLLQQLFTMNLSANTNTITHELSLWFTYWSKQSVYLPGFLSAFYEAPAVPPILRAGI